MVAKFVTLITGIAIALFGATVEANVPNPLEGGYGSTERLRALTIDLTPFLLRCNSSSYTDPHRSSPPSPNQDHVQDIFAVDFSILTEMPVAGTCEVPVPSLEQFRSVARQ